MPRHIAAVAAPLDIEGPHELVELTRRNDQIFFGDPDIVEVEIARRHAPETHEFFLLAETETRHPFLHEEAADPLVALDISEARVHHIMAGVPAAGNEAFPSIEDIMIAILHRVSRKSREVRPRFRLSHAY